MAIYKAIANGNADTLGIWETWNGSAWVAASVLPGESDDVYTNGHIVTVTTSQAYKSWNRSSVEAPYNITQGGQFRIDGRMKLPFKEMLMEQMWLNLQIIHHLLVLIDYQRI